MPTKEQFEAYVKVQRSGKYNMIMDWRAAAKEAGLDSMTYMIIISYYLASSSATFLEPPHHLSYKKLTS